MERVAWVLAGLVGFAVVAAPLVGGAQEAKRTRVHTPEDEDPNRIMGGLSVKAQDIVPQLIQSVEIATQVGNMVRQAQTDEDLRRAAELISKAYVLQRAAHAGIGYLDGPKQKPGSMIPWEYRAITASRKNLISAQSAFRTANITQVEHIESGMDYLRAAIGQTQSVLAVHH